ncbi:MAG: TldD/PmbA family protein [Candidatus Bathyarchaeia archaeon]
MFREISGAPILEDILEFAVKYAGKLGSTYAEARGRRDISNAITMKNGEVQFSGFLREFGLGVRLIVNGALGFASTNMLSRGSVINILSSAASIARASSSKLSKTVRFSNEYAARDKWEAKQKIRFDSVSIEDKIELLYNIDKIFRSRRNVTFPSRVLILNETLTEQVFLNSEGASIRSKIPRVSFSYMLTAYAPGKGTIQRFNKKGESRGWEAVDSWELDDLASSEAKVLESVLTEGRKTPKGELDIILGSEVVGIVCHESCGHPFEADRILGREAAAAGESFITRNMLGEKLGSEEVTVVDDPTLPYSYGFYLYDDEGVRTSRRELIKNGVINSFLHNRETAAEMGIQSNGAARAVSYSREPIIRMSNTYMERGEYSFEELVESIKEGVYIKNFMEWNIDDVRFNQRYVGLEAYRIRKGEVTYPVRNPILEITTPGLFTSIDAVGRNVSFTAATCGKGDPMQGAPVWTGGPDVRLRRVRLGGY